MFYALGEEETKKKIRGKSTGTRNISQTFHLKYAKGSEISRGKSREITSEMSDRVMVNELNDGALHEMET